MSKRGKLAYKGSISVKENGKYTTIGRIVLFKNNNPKGENPPKLFGSLVFFGQYLGLKNNLKLLVSLWNDNI